MRRDGRLRYRYVLWALAASHLLIACEKRADDAPSPPVPPAHPGPTAAAAEAIPPPATRVEHEKAAREAMTEWLRTQNEGDFDSYSRLYARQMLGIKRSGDRTRRLDRAGWIADRKQMFRKPMVVRLSGLRIDVLSRAVVASFVQRWSSAKYQDVGPKRMVFVLEKDGWRISREEMLRSTVLGSEPKQDRRLVSRFAFAEQVDDTTYLILRQQVDPNWAASPPRALGADHIAAEAGVELDRVPAELRDLVARPVRLYGRDGQRCEAKVDALLLLGIVRANWPQDFVERQAGTPIDVPPDEAARAVMRLGGPHLVARVDKVCGRVLWGQWADEPEPKILDKLPGTKAVSPKLQAGVAAFMGETEYAATQARWEKHWLEAPDPPPAAKWSDDADLRVQAWGLGEPAVITVEAWQDPCGGYFDGALLGVYPVTDGSLRPAFKDASRLSAAVVFDLELDGSYEVLAFDTDGGLHLIAGGRDPTVAASYRPPSFGCRC